ncbi:alpha/beta fold hydrolase [Nocardiopsis rhodophaea]|uniref:Alpha/beta fold hydrolase n=1 Tax=Nocardiopsis rhodophaea TaxID=280238 RepID=A0ABN2TLB7_9ACTN
MTGIRLICLHHAGGSPSVFSPWVREAPSGVQVVTIALPQAEGPARRRRYRTIEDLLPVLAADIEDQLSDSGTGPYVLFGHSMGGLLAYLLARRMAEGSGPVPAALVVAGYGAPHAWTVSLDYGDDRDLVRRLHGIGGLPDWVVANPVWLEPMLGPVRDDVEVCRSYRHTPQQEKLPFPVHVFAGNDDLLIPREYFLAWREYADEVSINFVDSGHFLVSEDTGHFRKLIFELALGQLLPPPRKDGRQDTNHPFERWLPGHQHDRIGDPCASNSSSASP